MYRRIFLRLSALVIASSAFAQAQQQPPRKVARIGVLASTPMTHVMQDSFREGLRDKGYIEGQNIVVEWRSAGGQNDLAKTLAVELVHMGVDVIVAIFTPAVQAAKEATKKIPIVMAPAGDPVATGLVASLAHPGGNITGVAGLDGELQGKRIALLKELIPGLTRVGLLVNATDPFAKSFIDGTQSAAKSAAVKVDVIDVRHAEQIDSALATLARNRTDAVIVQGVLAASTWRSAALAKEHRLPSLSVTKQFAEDGGVMSYSASLADTYRRAASYVDKILKGDKPSDLPVEQPTKFELVINLRTAKTLGLTVPQSLLLRADELIQ